MRSSSLKRRSRSCLEVTYFPSRRVVDDEIDRNRRFLDRDALEPVRRVRRGEGLPDFDRLETAQRNDVAGVNRGDLDAMQAVERVQLGDATALHALLVGRDESPIQDATHLGRGLIPDGFILIRKWIP